MIRKPSVGDQAKDKQQSHEYCPCLQLPTPQHMCGGVARLKIQPVTIQIAKLVVCELPHSLCFVQMTTGPSIAAIKSGQRAHLLAEAGSTRQVLQRAGFCLFITAAFCCSAVTRFPQWPVQQVAVVQHLCCTALYKTAVYNIVQQKLRTGALYAREECPICLQHRHKGWEPGCPDKTKQDEYLLVATVRTVGHSLLT